MKRILIFITSFLLFGSLQAAAPKEKMLTRVDQFFKHALIKSPELSKIKTKTVPLGRSINCLKVHEFSRVSIHVGAAHPRVALTGVDASVLHVAVDQRNHQLVVKPNRYANPKAVRSVHVVIYVNHVNQLQLSDIDLLTIQVKHNRHFSLKVDDVKRFNIQGDAVIPQLTFVGDMNFATSDKLTLKNVYHYGNGDLEILNARGKNISIDNLGDGNVVLKGKYGLARFFNRGNNHVTLTDGQSNNLIIDTDGNGHLILTGIHTKKLMITARGNNSFQIKGRTRYLNVDVHDQVGLHAADLTAYSAYVKTFDNAVVQVRVLHRIFVDSVGSSRVEYFGRPPYHFARALCGSAVLPLTPG